MADMSTFLSTKVADYTLTEMTLAPQQIMEEKGDMVQHLHQYDDGDFDVVTTSGSSFRLTMKWDYMTFSDASTLLDFWHNKTNGREKTFYFVHPTDGNTYVARFFTHITFLLNSKIPLGKQVSDIVLHISGVKA